MKDFEFETWEEMVERLGREPTREELEEAVIGRASFLQDANDEWVRRELGHIHGKAN